MLLKIFICRVLFLRISEKRSHHGRPGEDERYGQEHESNSQQGQLRVLEDDNGCFYGFPGLLGCRGSRIDCSRKGET